MSWWWHLIYMVQANYLTRRTRKRRNMGWEQTRNTHPSLLMSVVATAYPKYDPICKQKCFHDFSPWTFHCQKNIKDLVCSAVTNRHVSANTRLAFGIFRLKGGLMGFSVMNHGPKSKRTCHFIGLTESIIPVWMTSVLLYSQKHLLKSPLHILLNNRALWQTANETKGQ